MSTSISCGCAEMLARVDAALLAAQPFAVQEMRTGELGPKPRTAQPLDRLPVQTVGYLTFAQQRPRAGLDPERPVGAAGARSLRKPIESVGRDLAAVAPDRRLDQL